MASTGAIDVYDTILRFGDYYQRRYFLETNSMKPVHKTLSAEDVAYYQQILDSPDLSAVFEKNLHLDLGFFYGVRDQIQSILRVWDAVLTEKVRYDAEGWPSTNRQFIKSFFLCLYTVPAQIKIGYFGPSMQHNAGTYSYPEGLPIILSEEDAPLENDVESGSASSFGAFVEANFPADHTNGEGPEVHESQASDFYRDATYGARALSPLSGKHDVISVSSDDSEDSVGGASLDPYARGPLAETIQPDNLAWGGGMATLDPRELVFGDMGGLEEEVFEPGFHFHNSLPQLEASALQGSSITNNRDTQPLLHDASKRWEHGGGQRGRVSKRIAVPRKRKLAELDSPQECRRAMPSAMHRNIAKGRARRDRQSEASPE
ncbi:Uu.00g130170.m01.CDS01 [Anthostomella pinea]|uniref:Uu.00g130170.m01.CDS01 n=1 Tax=Anthostomella pinea TaxID=933095 RepID=A0AAI8YFR0_9PEZI|nr:Uu.00g130170.m01.CDS01 [Anthostomella pinea]